jgi:hypothetical protein
MTIRKKASLYSGGVLSKSVLSGSELLEEVDAYASLLNHTLADHPLTKHLLPIKLGDHDLINKVKDGLVLAALLDSIQHTKGALDTNRLNKAHKLNKFQMSENHRIVLDAAAKIGIKLVNVGEADLVEGKPSLVLGATKQILKFKRLEEFNALLEEHRIFGSELIKANRRLNMESANSMMIGFINAVLALAGRKDLFINNLAWDLQNSNVYMIVLNQIDAEKCPLDHLLNPDKLEKAAIVVEYAERIGARSFIRPQDIVNGNATLNFDLIVAIASCPTVIEKIKSKKIVFGQKAVESQQISASDKQLNQIQEIDGPSLREDSVNAEDASDEFEKRTSSDDIHIEIDSTGYGKFFDEDAWIVIKKNSRKYRNWLIAGAIFGISVLFISLWKAGKLE